MLALIALGTLVYTFRHEIAAGFSWLWDQIKAGWNIFKDFWMSTVPSAFVWVWEQIKAGWNIFKDFWMQDVPGAFRSAWEFIKIGLAQWGVIFGTVWQGIKTGWNAFKGFWVKTVPAGFKIGINAIISGIEAIPNAFIAGMNEMIKAWNRFSINTPAVKVLGKTVIPSISWNTPDIPLFQRVSIPRLAEGGIVPATPGGRLVVVGEGGQDEEIRPLGSRGQQPAKVMLEIHLHTDGGLIMQDELREFIEESVNISLQKGGLEVGTG